MRRVLTYNEQPSLKEARPLQDFITHRILDRAQEYELPVIIHTGFQCHGIRVLGDSRASKLTNLFIITDVPLNSAHSKSTYIM